MRTRTIPRLLRHLLFGATAVVVVSRGPVAHAQTSSTDSAGRPQPPILCRPNAPTPGCQLAPPGQPPPITQQEYDNVRAQTEAEWRAQRSRPVYDEAMQRVYGERAAAYQQRVEDAIPPDVPVKLPTLEVTPTMTLGAMSRIEQGDTRAVYLGPGLTLGYRFASAFAVEVPIFALSAYGESSSVGSSPRWNVLAARPSLTWNLMRKTGVFYLRGGPEVFVNVDAPDVVPTTYLGAHVGIGMALFQASIGDGGYIGVAWDVLSASIRAGVGRHFTPFGGVLGGLDSTLGVRFAY